MDLSVGVGSQPGAGIARKKALRRRGARKACLGNLPAKAAGRVAALPARTLALHPRRGRSAASGGPETPPPAGDPGRAAHRTSVNHSRTPKPSQQLPPPQRRTPPLLPSWGRSSRGGSPGRGGEAGRGAGFDSV